MMDVSAAAEQLRLSGVLSAEPAIPQDVYLNILEETARAATHATATAYGFGTKVFASVHNGRLYRCITPGTSGATAPTWPTFQAARPGQQITDGTVVWQDAGPVSGERYDLNAAKRECWLWRAGQLAEKFDVSDPDANLKRSQQYEHAVAQARRYGPRYAL